MAVARALLGQRLVRVLDNQRLGGLICEVEAYGGADDQASHACRRTPRSTIMFGPPGIAYVYFIYGMHYCLNAVTECDGQPGAVLIRSISPEEGIGRLRANRPGVIDRHLADGPGKLCQALSITAALNGIDLTGNSELFIAAGEQVAAREIIAARESACAGTKKPKLGPGGSCGSGPGTRSNPTRATLRWTVQWFKQATTRKAGGGARLSRARRPGVFEIKRSAGHPTGGPESAFARSAAPASAGVLLRPDR